MEHNGWLKALLENMQSDLDEIKADIKSLQQSKFMLDGAKETVRLLVTVGVSLLTVWMSHK